MRTSSTPLSLLAMAICCLMAQNLLAQPSHSGGHPHTVGPPPHHTGSSAHHIHPPGPLHHVGPSHFPPPHPPGPPPHPPHHHHTFHPIPPPPVVTVQPPLPSSTFVRPSNWVYVIPHGFYSGYSGTYYSMNGRYYFSPQVVTAGGSSYLGSSTELGFGTFSHVSDLAARLVVFSNDLCLDLNANYAHNPGYSTTYRDAYEILEIARSVQSSQQQLDRLEVQNALMGADPLLHQVQATVSQWTRIQSRQVGRGDATSKMELIDAALHHLLYNAGVPSTATTIGVPTASIEQAPLPTMP